MKKKINELLDTGMNKGLSWTTIASEKLLLAIIGISTCIASAIYLYEMLMEQNQPNKGPGCTRRGEPSEEEMVAQLPPFGLHSESGQPKRAAGHVDGRNGPAKLAE